MPLVLSLRKGHGFHVGDHHVQVVSVQSAYEFSVRANDNPVKEVKPDVWVEVLPGVLLQAGVPQSQEGKIIRVVIDAPGLKIVRDGAKDPHSDCEVCHGTKTMKVKETCSFCKGFGCARCDQGIVIVGHACPECT